MDTEGAGRCLCDFDFVFVDFYVLGQTGDGYRFGEPDHW